MKTDRVALFVPCFVNHLFPGTGIATLHILEKVGCKVYYPREQTCCGQHAFNSGYTSQTLSSAVHFLQSFNEAEVIVSPSASCVSTIRNQYRKLPFSDDQMHIYNRISKSTFELSEYLVDQCGIDNVGGVFPHRVAYHASCHGLRELNIKDQPLRLLSRLEGIELVELDDRQACCGFGGTFSMKYPGISQAIGRDKLKSIEQSKAEYVTATDDSCLMHIQGLAGRNRQQLKVFHYAQILHGSAK